MKATAIVVVCLLFLGAGFASNATAWDLAQAAYAAAKDSSLKAAAPQAKTIYKVKPNKIVKCRPVDAGYDPTVSWGPAPECILPFERPQGWSVDVEGLYARTKGKVRFTQGLYTPYNAYEDVDLNKDLGVSDHRVTGSVSARYRLNPAWSLRYSIMPLISEDSGFASRSFNFGTINLVAYGQATKIKWDHIYQRVGLVYDPIRTYSSRVSVFADFVRLDDKLEFTQVGCCTSTMTNDLNMGMAGVELEKCLKTTRSCSTLALECRAGVAFGDDAMGSDLSTGVKYSIPLSNGRWGFVKGGYRYLTYKKKYSDAKLMDTCIEGGFVQMGFVF